MFHRTLLSLLCSSAISLCMGGMAGCQESEDGGRRAPIPRDGLMPLGGEISDRPDLLYVDDQSKIKLLPETEISYEPLETFRAKARAEAEAANPKQPDAAAMGAAPGAGGFWYKVGMKAMMSLMTGGKAPPAGLVLPHPPAKADKPQKDDEEDGDKDDADENGDEDTDSEDADSDDDDDADEDGDGDDDSDKDDADSNDNEDGDDDSETEDGDDEDNDNSKDDEDEDDSDDGDGQ